MSPYGLDRVELVVRTIAETALDNETYFGQLDSVVGDGDFGYSLARGFENVLERWAEFDRTAVGAFLKQVAVVITSRVGGTSGPIWGTAFLRAATAAGESAELTGDMVVTMLRASITGIQARGQAQLGDKTLLDALVPAVDAFEERLRDGADASEAIESAAKVARQTAEATVTMQARRGRASYTGERSIGSVDPGAIAIAVMFERISASWSARPT